MVSVIIPTVNDPYLQATVDDITKNFRGRYEIITSNGIGVGLRAAVNAGVARSHGDYIMKVDDHCKFDEGLDIKLLSHIEDNWIVVPRRYNLDVTTWERMDEEPIDYDRLATTPDKLGGVRWRRKNRPDVDETMVFQGSFYLMSRKHWDWLGGLQEEGYGPFAQEAIELALKTWLGGGAVMVNKGTWYAHKHRKFGRVVSPSGKSIRRGNKYSKDYWMNNRWEGRIHDFEWLMKRFGI